VTLKLIYPTSTQVGLDLEIIGSGHSVADLLTVWQPLCDDEKVFKQFAAGQHAACISCVNNCCNSAYVTPDIISLRRMAAHTGLSLAAYANRYLDADKLSLGLPVLKQPCPWLAAEGRCDVYEARSLLCRFYLCTPLSGQLEQLIYSIALVGVVSSAQELGLNISLTGLAMSSFDRLNLEEIVAWSGHPGVAAFCQAANYQEVPLDIFLVK